MALTCGATSCDHEFDDALWSGELEARDAGEVPYFTHVQVPDDGLGVETVYLCSTDCVTEYVEEVA